MSKKECPPAAIIRVFINCIVDGEMATQQVGCDDCLYDGNNPAGMESRALQDGKQVVSETVRAKAFSTSVNRSGFVYRKTQMLK